MKCLVETLEGSKGVLSSQFESAQIIMLIRRGRKLWPQWNMMEAYSSARDQVLKFPSLWGSFHSQITTMFLP